jgi:hypothetical protein
VDPIVFCVTIKDIALTGHTLCDHFAPIDESSRNPNRRAYAKAREISFYVAREVLANHTPTPTNSKGTNGFMLTFDMTSKDVPAQKGSSMSY